MSIHQQQAFRKTGLVLAAAAASAVLLGAAPAWSQGSTSAAGAAGTGNAAARSGFDSGDRKMLEELAQGNLAEVEAGKLALEKASSEETKKFAQQMIDDHTAALKDIQVLADSKGLKLPTEPRMGQKTKALALKALPGNTFDKQYRSQAGVGDHERTVKLLQKIQKDAKDADFKALAGKMLPTVEQHLRTAMELSTAKPEKSAQKP